MESILSGLELNPAFAVDRHWTIIQTNKAAHFLLSMVDSALLEPPINMLRIGLHPSGLTPHIINYSEWCKYILEYLNRQVELTADTFLAELLEELKNYSKPELTKQSLLSPLAIEYDRIAVGLSLKSEAGVMSFLVATTVFGTSIDVTLSKIAI